MEEILLNAQTFHVKLLYPQGVESDISIVKEKDFADKIITKYSGKLDSASKEYGIPIYKLSNNHLLAIVKEAYYGIVFNTLEDFYLFRNFVFLLPKKKSNDYYYALYYDEAQTKLILDSYELVKNEDLSNSLHQTFIVEGRYLVVRYTYQNDLLKYHEGMLFNSKLDIYEYGILESGDQEEHEEDYAQRKIFIDKDLSIQGAILSESYFRKIILEYDGMIDKNISELAHKKVFILKKVPNHYIFEIDPYLYIGFDSLREMVLFYESRKFGNKGLFSNNPRLIFENLIKDSIEFINNVEENSLKIASLLNFKATELDKSYKSLKFIEDRLSEYFFDEYMVNIFSVPLLSYVAQVIIKEKDGTIQFRKIGEGTFVPFIFTKDGIEIEYCVNLWDQLHKLFPGKITLY